MKKRDPKYGNLDVAILWMFPNDFNCVQVLSLNETKFILIDYAISFSGHDVHLASSTLIVTHLRIMDSVILYVQS